jgi:hypothetical protein
MPVGSPVREPRIAGCHHDNQVVIMTTIGESNRGDPGVAVENSSRPTAVNAGCHHDSQVVIMTTHAT